MHDEPLDLQSTYMSEQPAGRAHMIRLQLRAIPDQAALVGRIHWDPNTCSLDNWGDRGACTRMAIFSKEMRATLMRTLDPRGQGRRYYSVHIEDAAELEEKYHLIEHARAHLWYLVIEDREQRRHVVPLFPTELFADLSPEQGGAEPVPG